MKSRRGSSPLHPFGSLIALGGVALLGLLLFASRLYLAQPEQRPAPIGLSRNWQQTFQQHLDHVTAELEKAPVHLGEPELQPQGSGDVQWSHRQYRAELVPADVDRVKQLLGSLHDADPAVTVSLKENADGFRGNIGVDGLLTHTVEVHWKRAGDGPPRVAVIIDDLGNDMLVARSLVSIDLPIAFAIMPFRPFSHEVAQMARLFDHEVLLHLPMEAENELDYGDKSVLRTDATQKEIARQVESSLDDVPNVVGVNNHMGSRFTQDRQRMTWVLQLLKQHHLFFVDSLTTADSVGREVAAEVEVPYLERQVFLDNPDDEKTVYTRLAELLDLAKHRGKAIGIGHPRPSTVEALRTFGKMAQEQGVEIVPLSALLSPASSAETARAGH